MFLLQIGQWPPGFAHGGARCDRGVHDFELSLIASAYFVGFLGGFALRRRVFIAKVGPLSRVFAALGSLISATLISYPVLTDPYAWMVLRVILGFSLSGVYVTAESWLNDASTNQTRGAVAVGLTCWCRCSGWWRGRGLLSAGDRVGLPSVHHSLDPRLDQLRADPLVGAARPRLRCGAPHEPDAALPRLALRGGGACW